MKTQYKISFLLLSLAWLPYAGLVGWGLDAPIVIRVIIMVGGAFIWFLGALSFSGISNDKLYWNKIEELEQKIKKTEDAWDLYKKAEERLIHAAITLKPYLKSEGC